MIKNVIKTLSHININSKILHEILRESKNCFKAYFSLKLMILILWEYQNNDKIIWEFYNTRC